MMKKSHALLYVPLFLGLTICILTQSELAFDYASAGLTVWFDRMIPTLLPFMILSGLMVRMRLTGSLTCLFSPLLTPIFRVSPNCLYVILMGSLCGFPMGAKCTADMMEQGLISRREGRFLLAFCNQIGPVYFCGYVLPLLGIRRIGICLFGMYGLPLLYGLLLRYAFYRDLNPARGTSRSNERPVAQAPLSLPDALDSSVTSALQSMTTLGGYMILFNLLNLVPYLSFSALSPPFDSLPALLAPLLEISGGLKMLGAAHPLYSLVTLSFGGFSCIAQTYACIRGTGLSLSEYVLHKLILSAVTAAYYFLVAAF